MCLAYPMVTLGSHGTSTNPIYTYTCSPTVHPIPSSHGTMGSHGMSTSTIYTYSCSPTVHPIPLSHGTLGSHGMSTNPIYTYTCSPTVHPIPSSHGTFVGHPDIPNTQWAVYGKVGHHWSSGVQISEQCRAIS